MDKIRKIIAVAVTISLSAMLETHAQTSFSSLQDLWQYADEHNAEMTVRRIDQTIADRGVSRAYGELLPTLTATGSYTNNIDIQPTLIPEELFGGEPGTFRESTFGRQYTYNAGVTAQLDLINTRDWFAIKSAKYGAEIARLGLTSAKHDLYVSTASAYYHYQVMAAADTLARESLEIARESDEAAKQRFAKGQVSMITVNTAAINLRKAQMNIEVAEQGMREALNGLRAILNLDVSDTLLLVAESESLPSTPEDVTSFPQTTPEVELAYAGLLNSENDVRAARSAFAPTLSAVYGAGFQIAGDDFMSFDNSNTLPQQYWGLRLSIPIFSGSSRSYELRKSKLAWESSQAQYQSLKRQSAIDDNNMTSAYHEAFEVLMESNNILALYKENDGHHKRMFDEGMISLDERLKAYQDYVTYQQEYLNHLADYYVQYYRVQVRKQSFDGVSVHGK